MQKNILKIDYMSAQELRRGFIMLPMIIIIIIIIIIIRLAVVAAAAIATKIILTMVTMVLWKALQIEHFYRKGTRWNNQKR